MSAHGLPYALIIGGLIIGRIEFRLVVVKVYGRAFFVHRTTVVCAGCRDWRKRK
jgi:hypothetical protein